MTHSDDIWDDENLDSSWLERWPDGWTVRHVTQTTSTNDELLRAAERGELGDRSVLVADHQTSGRGRLDRRWDAPPRTNLLASMYLAEVPKNPTEVMQRVGIAIVDAVEHLLGGDGPGNRSKDPAGAAQPRHCGLKWPNDVLLGGLKLAGVLAQRSTNVPGVVVGFGVNVGWAPSTAARLGSDVDTTPATLLRLVLEAFDRLPADVSTVYHDRLDTIGHIVRVELPGGEVQRGRATDVDDMGRLVVLDQAGREHRFGVGDVIHLRLA
jgi:BirA family biotin operon repressor/biotin-[acetyl-CoA-carboxylase] ligase